MPSGHQTTVSCHPKEMGSGVSQVKEPGLCYCACHKNLFIMHGQPCCLGKCLVCKKFYTTEDHVESCRKRMQDLAAGIED
jgi:hypothetical protein